ncbi:hypothetical protein AAMO2058_001461200 [Amorphochlora amoebiformis]
MDGDLEEFAPDSCISPSEFCLAKDSRSCIPTVIAVVLSLLFCGVAEFYTFELDEEDIFNSSQPPIASSRNTIAICYSGHIRSFSREVVLNNHYRNMIQPLQRAGFERVDLFMQFASGNCLRAKWCKDEAPEEASAKYHKIKEFFRSKGISPDSIHIHHDPKKLRFSSESIEKLQKENCGRSFRWKEGYFIANMWNRIEQSYIMATAAEKEQGFKYSAIIKMRPDLYFLEAMDAEFIASQIELHNPITSKTGHLYHWSDVQKDPTLDAKQAEWEALIPSGSLVINGGFNDWAAVCIRDGCDTLLRMIDTFAKCAQVSQTNVTTANHTNHGIRTGF